MTRSAAIASLLVFAVSLTAYALQLPAGPGIGDEAEAQTVPYILGIAHPTGFPAYALVGWVWSHAFAAGSVAWRLNALTAVLTAASAGGVVLLATALGADAIAAALAALAFAFGTTVWNGASHANAHVLAGACEVFVLLASVTFVQRGERRMHCVAAACCGLGIAAHPAAVWTLPALLAAGIIRRDRIAARGLVLAALALLAPLTLYAYPLVRSPIVAAQHLDPNAASVVAGAGDFDWNVDVTRARASVLDQTLGRNVNAASSLLRAFDPRALPAAVQTWFVAAAHQFGMVLLVLAAAGIVAATRCARRELGVLIAGCAGGIAFAYVYRTDAHIDRYLIASFAVTATLAAVSTRLVIPRLPVALARPFVRTFGGTVLAALVLFAVRNDAPSTRRAPALDGAAIVAAVARDTPPDAIVVAQWNDAAALGYGAYVDHALASRTIVSAWPDEFADRYAAWAARRPLILYVSPLGRRRLGVLPMELQTVPASIAGYTALLVRPVTTRPSSAVVR